MSDPTCGGDSTGAYAAFDGATDRSDTIAQQQQQIAALTHQVQQMQQQQQQQAQIDALQAQVALLQQNQRQPTQPPYQPSAPYPPSSGLPPTVSQHPHPMWGATLHPAAAPMATPRPTPLEFDGVECGEPIVGEPILPEEPMTRRERRRMRRADDRAIAAAAADADPASTDRNNGRHRRPDAHELPEMLTLDDPSQGVDTALPPDSSRQSRIAVAVICIVTATIVSVVFGVTGMFDQRPIPFPALGPAAVFLFAFALLGSVTGSRVTVDRQSRTLRHERWLFLAPCLKQTTEVALHEVTGVVTETSFFSSKKRRLQNVVIKCGAQTSLNIGTISMCTADRYKDEWARYLEWAKRGQQH